MSYFRAQWRFLTLVSAILALPCAAASPIFEHSLRNGLRVIVQEDHRAPTAVHMVWYRAGSVDEQNGTTGVAHVLEHMMFKGTPSVGPGEFNRRVAAVGGRDNAFTSRDYTAYFQQVPSQKLAEVMQLEADRMRHLSLDASAFAQEIKVVMEERRMRTDDQAPAKLFEQLNAMAFQSHPYRVPIIGWMNDLENMSVQDARAWYERWYLPNNAYVVIVGDVAHEQVFKWAETYYGALEARPLPLRKAQEEAAQDGVRRLSLKAPAALPVLLMGYKVPVLRDPTQDLEPYALEMLAAILDGYEAARLPQHLVRAQALAVEVGASYDSTARGPGMFYLQGSPSEGKTVAQLEAGLRAEIARIQQNGVSQTELARAKAQLLAHQVYKLDAMFERAMDIGQLEAVGIDYHLDARMTEQRQAVTAEAVQAVAQKYFVDERLSVGELQPQALPNAARKTAAQR
ncbi:MAG: pitrilysin family protein [Pseudomonadota bacterium]